MLLEQVKPLFEHLGNLKNLKVGSMIDVLKQTARSSKKGSYQTPVGNKFVGNGYYDTLSIGDTSEIIDVGVLKTPIIGSLRKAYKAHEFAQAFALYVDGKAVCFGTFAADTLGGSARTAMFAYDLTPIEAEVKKLNDEKLEKMTDYEKRYNTSKELVKKTNYSETKPDSWEVSSRERHGDKNPTRPNVYRGKITSTAELKAFLEQLETLVGDKKITCKIVLSNIEGIKKRRERTSNRLSQDEIYSGLDALKERLKKYKLSKKPSVDTIEDFMKATVEKTAKMVRFSGRTWNTAPRQDYDYNKISPLKLLAGGTFSVVYECVDSDAYGGTLTIFYKFIKETSTIVPFKATWSDEKREHITAVLNPETYLKDELKVDKVDKQTIMKSILTSMKDGNTREAKERIKAARQSGHDFPEFAAIEKSIKASEEKK